MSKQPITLTLTLSLILFCQPIPSLSAPIEIDEEYVEAHNKLRLTINVPPLKWSTQIAETATKLVAIQMVKPYGSPKINSTDAYPYGLNVFSSCTTLSLNSPAKDVEFWEKGKSRYDPETRSCKDDDEDRTCGSYRQIVWKETVEFGCSQAVPAKEYCKGTNLGSYTVCLYSPRADGDNNA